MSRRSIAYGKANVMTIPVVAMGAGDYKLGKPVKARRTDKATYNAGSEGYIRVRGNVEPKPQHVSGGKVASAKTKLARIKTAREWTKIREKEHEHG